MNSSVLEPNLNFNNPYKKGYGKEVKLEPNSFFIGRVIRTRKPEETIRVALEGVETPVQADFIWIAGAMSNMFGFNTTFMPPVNTKVLCYFTGSSPSFIVGCIPETNPQAAKGEQVEGTVSPYFKSAAFTSQIKDKQTPVFSRHLPLMDLMEGEIDISNMMGVGLTMLQNLAQLKAGDLAKIECSVIDDFVRIISQNFQHITPFGEYKISADGNRMNVIWQGSHHDHEVWGEMGPDSERVRYKPKNETEYLTDTERHEDTGRWRFAQYIGYLGNFINMFITEPMAMQGKIAESAIPRAGLGRLHVNDDGSILVQSMQDICFEHVTRIPVPIEIKPEYSHEGNLSTDEPDTAPLLKWDFKSVPNMFEAVYQLRDYSRWLSNYYSKARFHMLDKDYRVPTEVETPKWKEHGDDYERKKSTIAHYYVETYSCIRILRDGSIVVIDGYTNSIVLNKKGIQISSANNLQIESAGNINMVAGHDINFVAKRSVSINAIQEGLTMRAKKWFQGICTDNGILLQTDTAYTEDDPDDETHKVGGIVLRATNSKIRLSALKDIEFKAIAGKLLATASHAFFTLRDTFQVNKIFQIRSSLVQIDANTKIKQSFINKLFAGNTYKSGMGPHDGHIVKKETKLIIGKADSDELKSRNERADFRHATPVQQRVNTKDDEIYETLTQQQLKLAHPKTVEVQDMETWDLSAECELPGRGSCWPTIGMNQKVYRGSGDDLYEPSGTSVFPNEGTALTSQSIDFKVKKD